MSVSTSGNDNEQLHFTKTHLTDFRLMGMANNFAPAFDEHIYAAWKFHPRRVNVLLAVGRQIAPRLSSSNTELIMDQMLICCSSEFSKLWAAIKAAVSSDHFYM